jgi:ATP-dependent RNA helicase RhlE
MSFAQLDLRVELLKAVKTKGYITPTAIQAKAIPVILDGRDILAQAQTGTGKTDAFALPMVEILSRTVTEIRYPRALVLTPTRELALQVGESIKAYARTVSLRCTVVYGGVRIEPQIERLSRGVDILVATPGRLLDIAGLEYVNLSHIEFLVFDEADRMLDLGFSEEISRVLELVPAERRTMLFSATYNQQIRNLANQMLDHPEHVEVTPGNTAAESVVQKVHMVNQPDKLPLLIHLITKGKWSRVLVFVRTKHGANRITEKLLSRGVSAAALHGNKSQSFRTRTLKQFKDGAVRVLVATDVAARGLDISNLPYVVNYDMPTVAEDYVHRIGRTGRAGESGVAISLVDYAENRHLQAIEKLLNQKIPVETISGFTEDSDVSDFVLYRPNNLASEQKVSREIKELVEQRKAAKEQAKAKKKQPAGSDSGPAPKSKSRFSGKNERTASKRSRAGSRSAQSSPKGKSRGRK